MGFDDGVRKNTGAEGRNLPTARRVELRRIAADVVVLLRDHGVTWHKDPAVSEACFVRTLVQAELEGDRRRWAEIERRASYARAGDDDEVPA